MGLFGGDDRASDGARRLAEADLSELADLALPVVTRFDASKFGVHGPTSAEIAKELVSGKVDAQERLRLIDAVAEALQLLEHARLVRHEVRTSESPVLEFVVTRLGREAVASGDVRARLVG